MFVIITKTDLTERKDMEEIQATAAEQLNIDRRNVFKVINFTADDCNEDGDTVPLYSKQLLVINAFDKILAPWQKPVWTEQL